MQSDYYVLTRLLVDSGILFKKNLYRVTLKTMIHILQRPPIL